VNQSIDAHNAKLNSLGHAAGGTNHRSSDEGLTIGALREEFASKLEPESTIRRIEALEGELSALMRSTGMTASTAG
jgi:hypothetical protein